MTSTAASPRSYRGVPGAPVGRPTSSQAAESPPGGRTARSAVTPVWERADGPVVAPDHLEHAEQPQDEDEEPEDQLHTDHEQVTATATALLALSRPDELAERLAAL